MCDIISEMLVTRLCHDLAGPIGAVSNGAEFLLEEGFEMGEEALRLVADSAQQAVERLQFYRSAYGRVNGEGEESITELREKILHFYSSSRMEIDWNLHFTEAGNYALSRRTARVVLNLFILISTMLPRGGKVHFVIEQGNDDQVIALFIESDMIKWEADWEQALQLSLPEAQITPKNVQILFLARQIQAKNAEILMERTEKTVSFRLRKKA